MKPANTHPSVFSFPSWVNIGLVHILFWTAYLLFDTISTGAMLDNFFLSFLRSSVHGFLLVAMVYVHLLFFYPTYFQQRKLALYIGSCLLLIFSVTALRVQIDIQLNTLVFEENDTWFYESDQNVLRNFLEIGLWPAYDLENYNSIQEREASIQAVLKDKPYAYMWEYSTFYLVGMVIGTAIVFGMFGILRLVLDGYARQVSEQKYLLSENLRLRTQLNQHFLFNALGSLFYRFQANEDAQGKELTQNLKWMMQYAIEKCERKQFVSLADELEFARKYLSFHSYLAGKIHIPKFDPIHEQLGVMPMLLNPLLENAIKHGNLDKAEGWLDVHIDQTASNLTLSIQNSTAPTLNRPLLTPSLGIGLTNLENRLEMYYQDFPSYSFQHKKMEEAQHFDVSLVVPIVLIEPASTASL